MRFFILSILTLILDFHFYSQQPDSTNELRIMIFINGNRGPKFDKVTTDNKLHLKDPTGYWYNYDDTIIKRFSPDFTLYFDGHHPVSSSMHRTKARFAKAYILSRFCWIAKKSRWVLNKKYNPEGFEERIQNGNIAGQNFLTFLDSLNLLNQKIKVDIVSHSMGYAYSLGLIEIIDTTVTFGKMLAISPESASYKGYNWNLFEEIWQYGSNYGEPNADPIYKQDGIAVQMPILGIENLDDNKGGRLFLPENNKIVKKGFVRSHHLNWFQWFFTIKPGDKGYFTK